MHDFTPISLSNNFKFYDYFSSTSRNGSKIYSIDDILGIGNIDLLENLALPHLSNLEQLKKELRNAILTVVQDKEN